MSYLHALVQASKGTLKLIFSHESHPKSENRLCRCESAAHIIRENKPTCKTLPPAFPVTSTHPRQLNWSKSSREKTMSGLRLSFLNPSCSCGQERHGPRDELLFKPPVGGFESRRNARLLEASQRGRCRVVHSRATRKLDRRRNVLSTGREHTASWAFLGVMCRTHPKHHSPSLFSSPVSRPFTSFLPPHSPDARPLPAPIPESTPYPFPPPLLNTQILSGVHKNSITPSAHSIAHPSFALTRAHAHAAS